MKIVSTPYTLYNRDVRDPLIRELYNPKVKIVFMTIYRGNIESTLKKQTKVLLYLNFCRMFLGVINII